MLLPVPTNPYAPPELTSTLLFKSNFVNAQHDNGAVQAGHYLITGTESDTGFAWAGNSASYPNAATGAPLHSVRTSTECINDTTTVTTANINTLFGATFQNETGPSGSTERILFLEMKDSGVAAWGAQMWLNFQRVFNNTSPVPPVLDNLYVSYYFKYPTDLNSLPNGGEIILHNRKTGGYNNGSMITYGGDKRLSVRIKRPSAGGALYWSVECDCGANGTMPTHKNGATWKVDDEYWKHNDTTGVAVPVNQWGRLEIFSHSNAINGFLVVAIDGQIVCERVARTLGEYALPQGRIMTAGIYHSTTMPMSLKIAQLEMRDFPQAASSLYAKVQRYFASYPAEPKYSKRSSARIYWPLQTDIVPINASGSATFTRATSKWVMNENNKMIKLPTGAIGIRGARVTYNIINTSEGAFSINTRSSSVTGNADVPAGVGCATSTKLVEDTTVTNNHYGSKSVTVSATGAHKVRVYIKASGRTSVYYNGSTNFQLATGGGFSAGVDLVSGAVTGPSSASVTARVLGSGWVEIIGDHIATAAGTQYITITLLNGGSSTYTGDGVSGVLVTGVMAVYVGGDASSLMPPEYVSVGVLASPYYGSGADGVKHFNTSKDGNRISDSEIIGANIVAAAVTNTLLYCRDFTNAVWVKTNITAALTQTGIDGASNSASLLTATAANATVLQTITAAAAAGCSGFYIKRSAGTGPIYITRDGGTNWTDVTNEINSTDFTLVKIENTSVTNPQVGAKIATSGDAIIADAGINHLGTQISRNPVITASASVTVNAETLTITSANFTDSVGTLFATVYRDDWTAGNGAAVGSSTRGLYTSSATSGVEARDGTNTATGLTGTPSGTKKIGMRWTGSTMQAFDSDNGFGVAASYGGSFNLASLAALPGVDGCIRDIAVYNEWLPDNYVTSILENV